jgi:Tol biopolymer transport system component
MKADGTDVRQLTNFHKEDMAPKWSPDGKWIAFLSDREGRVRVFVVKPDGTGMRAVSGSQVTGEEREPAWSPDGKKLAFVGRAKDQKARIWVADMAGGEPVALTDGKSIDDQPAWSPDGKYVAFVSERTGDAELFLMRANGSGQTQLTKSKGADWLPRWFVPKAPVPAGPGAGRAEGT